MTSYRFGDLLLVEFPQVGSALTKKRPTLVILDIGDDDVVLAPITSQMRTFQGDLFLQDWRLCGLLKESWLRLAKVTSVKKIKISKVLGHLSASDKQKTSTLWRSLYQF
jgi:mRNA interferase MazF